MSGYLNVAAIPDHIELLEGDVEQPMTPMDWQALCDEPLPDAEISESDASCDESTEEDDLKLVSQALHMALRKNDFDRILLLLDRNFDPNFKCARGSSLLMVAAYRGLAEVCRRLLDAGADPLYEPGTAYDENDGDSLFRANLSHDVETIRIVERAWVLADWKSLRKIEQSDRSGFLYVGRFRLRDAERLGLDDLAAEIRSHGIQDEQDDEE